MHEFGGKSIKRSERRAPLATETSQTTMTDSAPIATNSGPLVSIVASRSMRMKISAKGAGGKARTKVETSDEPDSNSRRCRANGSMKTP